MNKSRAGISLLIAMLAVWVVTTVAVATPDTMVHLAPSSVEVNVGDQFTLELRVENVTALNGVDLRLTYNSAALQVQDADPVADSTQIQPGPFLQADQIGANNADGGIIHYHVEQLLPHTPVTGSGVVAWITFQARLTGTHTVAFDRVRSFLYRQDGTSLPVTGWGDATIVVPRPPTVLTGIITRQGWFIHDGTVVRTLFMAGPILVAPPPVATDRRGVFTVIIPDDFTGTSALASQSSVFPLPRCPRTSLRYQAAFIQASFPNYLSAEGWFCLSARITNLGSIVTLPGGDVNNDTDIDIRDIVKVIADLGKSVMPPCVVPVPEVLGALRPALASDVNGDCLVDIGDLALVAGNFDKRGPIPIGRGR